MTATRPAADAATVDEEWQRFADWLVDTCGYEHPICLDEHRYIALAPKFYTTQLVLGEIGDHTGLLDGWCYETKLRALAALLEWADEPDRPEPAGWFRQPGTGRRIARTPGEIDDHGRTIPVGQEYVRR